MAKSEKKPAARTRAPQARARHAQRTVRTVPLHMREPPETVDPKWLLQALGACLALALVCGYVTMCVLFARGQWELVLHPSRHATHTPAQYGLNAEGVGFAVGTNGQPELRGWWIPAASTGAGVLRPGGGTLTALMLPGGSGTAADDLGQAADLHNAGLNVLLFDYRGFGASGGAHPDEASMEEDSEHALSYLESTRHIPASAVVVYGEGLGASLATRLCAEHPALPALILESADGDLAEQVRHDERARIVPFSLLFHEDFRLATPLAHLPTPKLLISHTGGHPPVIYQRAATPKTMLDLPPGSSAATLEQALTRFLDSYVKP